MKVCTCHQIQALKEKRANDETYYVCNVNDHECDVMDELSEEEQMI